MRAFTGVWGGAVIVLEAAGHEVVWGGDWPEDPGDEEIIAKAHKEGRVLITWEAGRLRRQDARTVGRSTTIGRLSLPSSAFSDI